MNTTTETPAPPTNPHPLQLFFADGRPTERWGCGACGHVYQSESVARQCVFCNCSYCHKPVARPDNGYHRDCATASFEKAERDRFEKAENLTDYAGWVMCEGYGNNGYCESLDELIAELEDNIDPSEWPEYAWACKEIPFAAPDVDGIIEDITSDMFEDAIDHIEGRAELQAALDAFAAANAKLVSYYPDYKRAVLIPKPTPV